jgi:hypothetical protein
MLGIFALSVAMSTAQSPYPVQMGSPALTCKVYELAHSFALKIQPDITPAQSRAVWDALRLDSCNATLPGRDWHIGPLNLTADTYPAGVEIFVDAVHGSDAAAGTEEAPLRSLHAAQVLARKRASPSSPATITLRGGIYFLGTTLALTSEDNGLTIRSFPGEAAELSGAIPVGPLSWEPYNVTGGPTMTSIENTNLVYGASFGSNNSRFQYVGKTASAQECSDRCLRDSGCAAFTWHDGQQPAGSEQWELMCYFVHTGASYEGHAQTHHMSGIKRAEQNIWVARRALAEGMRTTGLRVDGKRAIRARWPNGDPEYMLFPAGWVASGTYDNARTFPAAADIVVVQPNRSSEAACEPADSNYCFYSTGVGGACAGYGYEPPSGYWCMTSPPRGGEYSVAFPSGLTVGEDAFDGRRWGKFKPNETVVNAFRDGHWFSYVFLVDAYDAAAQKLSWSWGGFQGGEGSRPGSASASEWNVENVFEELDAPNEWYLDTDSGDLFYFHNGSGAPTGAFSATALEQLVTINGAGSARGEQGAHAENITLRGLRFTGAALTTLTPHGLPSDGGGDWAVARRAAVHLSGVVSVTVEACTFERLDGNGIMISGFARDTRIAHNEFHLIGESGIVSWGYTADFADAKRAIPIPPTQGPDATDGNHPQRTVIEANFFHEIGHFQKQVPAASKRHTQHQHRVPRGYKGSAVL